MNKKMFALRQRRAELLARVAAEREQVAQIGAQWRAPLALADQGVAAVRLLRRHPLLVAGVVAFIVIRRPGLTGLVSVVWPVWKGYRYFTLARSLFSALPRD